MSVISTTELYGPLAILKEQFASYREENNLLTQVVHRVLLMIRLFKEHKEILLNLAHESSSGSFLVRDSSSSSKREDESILMLPADTAYVMHVKKCKETLMQVKKICDNYWRNRWIRSVKNHFFARTIERHFYSIIQNLASLQNEAHTLFTIHKEGQCQTPHFILRPSVALRSQRIKPAPPLSSTDDLNLTTVSTPLVSPVTVAREDTSQAVTTSEGTLEATDQILQEPSKLNVVGSFSRGASEQATLIQTRLKQMGHAIEAPIEGDQLSIDFESSLGKGSHSIVYAGTLLEGTTWKSSVAIKIVQIHPNDVSLYEREVATLRMISDHSNQHLLRFYGWSKVTMPDGDLLTGFVFERCKAPLTQALMDPYFSNIQDRVHVLKQILRAMSFLATKGVIHRHLKPDNILVRYSSDPMREFGDVVIGGFASTGTTQREGLDLQTMDEYTAPELRTGAGPSELSDVFSFGVIAAFVLLLINVASNSNKQVTVVSDEWLRHVYSTVMKDVEYSVEQVAKIELLCSCCASESSRRPRFHLLERELSDLMLTTRHNHRQTVVPSVSMSVKAGMALVNSPVVKAPVPMVSLAMVSADMAKLLLMDAGCNIVRDDVVINGKYLEFVDDIQVIQDLEACYTFRRKPAQMAVLATLRKYQSDGVPVSKLKELEEKSLITETTHIGVWQETIASLKAEMAVKDQLITELCLKEEKISTKLQEKELRISLLEQKLAAQTEEKRAEIDERDVIKKLLEKEKAILNEAKQGFEMEFMAFAQWCEEENSSIEKELAETKIQRMALTQKCAAIVREKTKLMGAMEKVKEERQALTKELATMKETSAICEKKLMDSCQEKDALFLQVQQLTCKLHNLQQDLIAEKHNVKLLTQRYQANIKQFANENERQIFSSQRHLTFTNQTIRAATKLWRGNKDLALQLLGPIGYWDTRKVTDMSELFKNHKGFNDDISAWDVSNVTNMEGMFECALSFDRPLDRWNVSKVTNMSRMFHAASLFNRPLNRWNVSNVTDMSSMFASATLFNQPLNRWNVSNVTDMSCMFHKAHSFNQSLDSWDVSSAIYMYCMTSTSVKRPVK